MGNISKQAARKFREYWLLQRGSEKGQDQQFWNMLLRDVLGMDDVDLRLKSQVPVPMKGTTKFLDFWIPETKVLIEHKSRDIKLDAPQSGHGGKTPFEQALEYNQQRGYSDKARWIVTCNFDEIWVYDMDRPLDEPQNCSSPTSPRSCRASVFSSIRRSPPCATRRRTSPSRPGASSAKSTASY